MTTKNNVVLELNNVYLSFGKLEALVNLTLELRKRELLTLIGPNGAGKTCVLNCINGFYRPKRGTIRLEGTDITRLPSPEIAGMGISRTFQNIELFVRLSVLENIMASRHQLIKYNTFASALYFGPAHEEEIRHRRVVEEIIDLMDLQPIREKTVGSLPYGQRKKVELARAIASEPKVLLLDEPMAGMNVEEKEDMIRYILDICELTEISILLVEHDMGVVMDIADRIVVLDFGVEIAEGTPEEIRTNADVIKAYLGKSD